MCCVSVQEPNAHLLLYVRAVKGLAKVLEGNHALAHLVSFQDRPLGNAHQLLLADVVADHHLEDAQQLVPRDRVIVVEVVHLEREPQLVRATVELVRSVLLWLAEMGEDPHELPEVDAIIVALCEEGVHDPIAKWVYGQLGDTKKVLPGQSSAITAILNGGNR